MTVTSIQTSRLLKKAGFPQEAYFYWSKEMDLKTWKLENREFFKVDRRRDIAALTAEDILDQLPIQLKTKEFLSIQKFNTYWVGYEVGTKTYVHFDDELLVEAAAKMYFYLKEKKLI